MSRVWSIGRYELKMQLRSIVFWLGVVLVAVMLFSEVVQPAIGEVSLLERLRTAPDSIRGDESFQRHVALLTSEGMPSRIEGPVWADRMAIVLAFAALFMAAFVFERDHLTGSAEIIAGRPTAQWEYFLGKYIGVTAALLLTALATLVVALATNCWAQSAMQMAFLPRFYLQPALVLLVTLLYIPALVMTVALALGRAVYVIPPFLLYLFSAIVPWQVNFILRSDNTERFWAIIGSGAALGNRLLYLGLTLAFCAAGAWLWGKRRVRG